MSDRAILGILAFARAVTTAFLGVGIGVHLARIGLDTTSIGIILSAGFAGCAAFALVATLAGDRIGRRRVLIGVALFTAAGTAVVAFGSSPFEIAGGAFLGALNGMGRDRGAAQILETAMLPSTTDDTGRTSVIAVYTMLQDIGHAVGSLLAAVPALLVEAEGVDPKHTDRIAILACAFVALAATALYVRLGPHLETKSTFPRLQRRTRSVLARIAALFAIDSLGGGFLTTALLSFFFFERFGASEPAIAVLFFGARLLNAGSHLGAAWLAKRIGLVNTMVFTHIPSSVLLVSVAFAPSFSVAAVLFLLREGLVEMDVPTRQSYVLAVVAPEERTFASGITNLVRLAAWAIAPAFAGLLMHRSLIVPLVVGASLKIAYDVLLWRAFRALPPPEETA